jgi:hypothetical protein
VIGVGALIMVTGLVLLQAAAQHEGRTDLDGDPPAIHAGPGPGDLY